MACMNKRAVASLLWFAMIWVAYEILWSVTGVLRPIGPVIAAAVAAVVAVDPLGALWPKAARRESTSLRPIRSLAGER